VFIRVHPRPIQFFVFRSFPNIESVFICVDLCPIGFFIPNSTFTIPHSRDSLPAIRAIPEARRDRLAALGAGLGRTGLESACLGMAGFIEDPAAAAAFQEGLSPLDGNQGNEEKTDVMVQALEAG
jgi:hypothetical protein